MMKALSIVRLALDAADFGGDHGWKEDLHPRETKGGKGGGRFRTKVENIEEQDDLSDAKHIDEMAEQNAIEERQDKGADTEQEEFNEEYSVKLPDGRIIDKGESSLYYDENGNLLSHRFSPFLKHQGGDGRISEQMNNILDRLYSGDNVSTEEIESTPEWQRAMEEERKGESVLMDEYGVNRTNDIQTPERNLFRKAIVNAALSDTIRKTAQIAGTDTPFEMNEGLDDGEEYQVAQERKVVIPIGMPASGKSTTYANPMARELKARLIDSDAIKKVLPEFDNGYGGNLVHEESSEINEEILQKSIERGDNIVHPILGANAEKLGAMIDNFHKHGYKVMLCFKDMPINVVKARLLSRFLKTGRFIPLHVIGKAEKGFPRSYEANKGKADAFVRSTNRKGFGNQEFIQEQKGSLD